jgi:hypothetical protein
MNLLLFLHFFLKKSEISNFRRPHWDVENMKYYFRQTFIFGDHAAAAESQPLFLAGVLAAAENKGLFSADFFWRPGTTENKPKAAENSLFSAANALFSAISGRRK